MRHRGRCGWIVAVQTLALDPDCPHPLAACGAVALDLQVKVCGWCS